LVWSGVVTFFQSYFGVFTIMLLTLYALLLHHLSINDLWKHVKKYWYLIVLFAITQLSIVYQAIVISHQLGDASIKTATGSIDWAARFIMPLYYAAEGQPLTFLYLFGLVVLVVIAFYKRSFFADARKRAMISIAVAHPILTYLFFYPIIGLDLLPRYGIVLTLACTFSAAILMKEFGTKITKVALACAIVLFLSINVHAIDLYWHPSSETVLLSTIETKYNTPTTVFIIDHSASHLNLPVNYESLLLLDQKRQVMGRFTFLSQNSELLKADTSFKPITITAYLDEEQAAALASYATSSDSVWLISRDCTNLCSATEIAAGSCFELNTFACGIQPQEVNTLSVYLASPRLGFSYIVRRVH